MSTNRSGRIDRAAAERLLAGPAVGAQGGQGALADLLAAAAAPATEAELTGETAAVEAFREAVRLGPPTAGALGAPARPARRLVSRRRTSARRTGVRAAVAALAVTALGSVAVAAGTGHLPEVLGGAGQRTVADPSSGAVTAPSATTHPAVRPTGAAPARTGPAGGSSTAAAATGGTATGSSAADDLVPLCRQWRGADNDSRFEPLTRAAGGSDRVPAYCAALLLKAAGGDQSPGATPGDGAGQGRSDPSDGTDPQHSATADPGKPDPAATGHGKPSPSPDPGRTKNGNHPSPTGTSEHGNS
ncbi:hypothetical protein C7C46_21600 [Streptomyces tateyamensis]|uniref:Uncharacterized protein n=1 Tax=Streptomyces tateyamensis TaxID=565073 RepID=A0A2V4NCC7_9ACTN|nr:hypothetical protein [Streptomyces tateyamensis]PYC76780.1 hypothetical protein C7C46_21600 [Streptomyces tateyamensis]